MRLRAIKSAILPILLLSYFPAFAAKQVQFAQVISGVDTREVARLTDQNKTVHVRVQQTYQGYPVFGADAVLHIPHGARAAQSVNGTAYQNLAQDLRIAPPANAQARKALDVAINLAQTKYFSAQPTDKESKLMVYVDDNHVAHWAFIVSFKLNPQRGTPAIPTYILDAQTFDVYESWNDMKTDTADVDAGGFGGNTRTGKFIYDGMSSHLAKISVQRNTDTNICYMKNATAELWDARKKPMEVVQFPCKQKDPQHDNIFWNANHDEINGGYSPTNDTLFGFVTTKNMYEQWYGVSPISKDGKPTTVRIETHIDMENGTWDEKSGRMTLGDGGAHTYPFSTLDTISHELSHGFTAQHSALIYRGQSGGLNESFSDMGSKAAEFYVYHNNTWEHGAGLMKDPNKALRYMDHPTRDCYGKDPGDKCSIETMDDYYPGIDVHLSSGVFNRAFYLLATSSGWDAKKAFEVMMKANMYYWTPNVKFAEAACGVMKATVDSGYSTDAVIKAFAGVGIDVGGC